MGNIMKKTAYYQEPEYQNLMESNPSEAQILEMLNQHNEVTPESPIKKDSILAAGLGAGAGMGAMGTKGYLKGKNDHMERAVRVADKYADKKIRPLDTKANSKLYKLINPVNSKMTGKLRDSRIDKLTKLYTNAVSPGNVKKKSWEAVKKIPKGKLLAAGGGGALLGLLANHILSKNQES